MYQTDADGHLAVRDLGDGRSLYVDPLTFGRARLLIGATGTYFYSDGW